MNLISMEGNLVLKVFSGGVGGWGGGMTSYLLDRSVPSLHCSDAFAVHECVRPYFGHVVYRREPGAV